MSRKDVIDLEVHTLPFPAPGDEVVISGIAGRFPKSDNLSHFKENLFNKVDLTTEVDPRWKADNSEIPDRIAKVNNADKLDAHFFGIKSAEADVMDPMARMLLEHTFEAIVDAGVNPQQLRGTNTGVFTGTCYSESEQIRLYSTELNGVGATGCCRAMMANRVSHWLGCHGPSYVVDTACSSSLFAIDHAYRAIRSGECDAVIVGGCNLCLHPNVTWQFSALGVLSADGYCRPFDADGNGYCRSEAISVIYLQKARDAKRVYAQIIHSKTNNDGYKTEGITFPSGIMQTALLKQFYEECKIRPSHLAFVEAHGTGTRAGDPVEMDAVDKVFCTGRTMPLRIGSVKSNLGHSEPASGLCSIAKVIIAMETGYIPPNLHYNRPREEIDALKDGRMQVITELTPWEGGYVGVNSFGFGGGNAHLLLKSNPKEKINGGAPNDDLPRLVVLSGRTKEAVTTLLDNLESRPIDVEYVSLFHNIHADEIPGHSYRGYTILPPKGLPANCVRDVRYRPSIKRPVWFVFPGLGYQWSEIGEALLEIPVFAGAIQKCASALKPLGLDISDLLTNRNSEICNNAILYRVGIAAIQIGLVDVLSCIGILPDNIIGSSIGELGCAYADGCLTAEQTVLAAYFEGLALIETESVRGSMATVALGKTRLVDRCPSDIDIACENSPECSVISGPTKSIAKFLATLKTADIFAKEESCNNIAYHSRYIAAAGPKLIQDLRKVIPESKPRSQKWLSTSVPRSQWENFPVCSPEYLMNNLSSPVLCKEVSQLIPNDAIIIEITPLGIFNLSAQKAVTGLVSNIALTNTMNKNSVEALLQSIGKMHGVGLQPQLTNLYPEISYPVSRGTPMISPLIRWEHSHDWIVSTFRTVNSVSAGEREVTITLADEDFEWMSGHVIDGKNLVPATGYLVLIWQTLAAMNGESHTALSVVFEDVRFHRATTIPKRGDVKLTLSIQTGLGRFEVSDKDTAVVTGSIRLASNLDKQPVSIDNVADEKTELPLTARDIYKELRLRGYQYTGLFRGLQGASSDGLKGRIAWEKNWVAFMDNMLQIQMLSTDSRGLFVPTGIEKLVIDTEMHRSQLGAMADEKKGNTYIHYSQLSSMLSEKREFWVVVDKNLGSITSGGIQIRGLKANAIARRKPAGDPVLEKFEFVAHRDQAEMELAAIIRMATHITLENHMDIRIKTIELIGDEDDVLPENSTSPIIKDVLADLPLLRADINIIARIGKFAADTFPPTIVLLDEKKLSTESDALLAISHGLFTQGNQKTLMQLRKAIKAGGFLLAREPVNTDVDIHSITSSDSFDIILEKRTSKELLFLLREKAKTSETSTVISIDNNEFAWLSVLQNALTMKSQTQGRSTGRILLVSEKNFESGLVGLINCLRREVGGIIIQGLLIQDSQAPRFSLENSFYSDQLKLGLTLNVLRPGKVWGSYRFLAMDPLTLQPAYHVRINQLARGDLSTLKWVCGRIQPNTQCRDIIKVHYASLNFRDIMLATGKLAIEVVGKTRQSQENVMGLEFSGTDADGRAVMGMIGGGALSNLCICNRELLWPVPDNWTLEDAATVPAVYGTVCYALYLRGEMKRGDKVLIHAGSGGVGQAAITLALHEDCEVFTTVGTLQKREFIKNQFPQIDDDHIGNSRDTSFEQLILRKTRGRGVDIVLNSLAEEKLQASVRCLGMGGRFLEIGKFDLAVNNTLGMEHFLKGIKFHAILFDNLLIAAPERRREVAELMTKGLKSGAIKPLVRTVFSKDQIETAFRYMAAGKHIGKVLIKIREENEVCHSSLTLALPRYHCPADRSYLILGGLGGFGLELADWLVLRGAKKLVLTSRKGISNGYQCMRIKIWKGYGVKVVIVTGKDASIREECIAILNEAIALGPVEAIFNLAVVLKDGLYENQTAESFEESLRVKAWATKQLDVLSRTFCPHLRQFVVFSSVSCGRGNAGQTNYGMANSVMERICEARAAEKLPGLAIQWGAIGDVGLVAELQEDDKEIVIGGTLQQSIVSCLQVLDGFLNQNSCVVSSMVVAEKNIGGAGVANVVDAVLNIMGLKDLKTVGLHTPLPELGMDSMMGVEIKQVLERDFEVLLTASDIRSLSFSKLQEIADKQSEQVDNFGAETNSDSEHLVNMDLLMKTLGSGKLNKDTCVPLTTSAKNGHTVFIVPGIEGTHSVFQPLTEKLKSLASCLQLATCLLDSVDDMANYLFSYLKKSILIRTDEGYQDFVIVGYSFGSLVAFELVRRLEAGGSRGRLVLIDGSPDHMQKLFNQLFVNLSDEQIETKFLLHLVNTLLPTAYTEFTAKIKNCNTWEEKLAILVKLATRNAEFTHTPEDLRVICTSMFCRIKATLNYKCSTAKPLNTPIILIKPQIASVSSMPEDYGLRSLTQGKVEIYFAEGNHLTMLNDDICAAAIDGELAGNKVE